MKATPEGVVCHGHVPHLRSRLPYTVLSEHRCLAVACLPALCGEAGEERPQFLVALLALWPGLMALSGLYGQRFAGFVAWYMVATILVMLVELLRPQLQLRKPPPEPEIRLNIYGPLR